MLTDLMSKLSDCIRAKKLNTSSIREVILKELVNTPRCLSSEEMHKRISEKVTKKVSYNTVYRVLKLFEECDLVAGILNNKKQMLYCIKVDESNHYFLCSQCDEIYKIEKEKSIMTDNSRLQRDSFIVIHSVCEKCTKK